MMRPIHRLNTKHTLGNPIRPHLCALCRRQPAEHPLADPVRGINTRVICCLLEELADDVNRALLSLEDVPAGVLWIVYPTAKANAKDWGIVVHQVGVAERAEVCAQAVRRDC